MRPFEFYVTLLSYYELYLLIFIVVCVLYTIILRKRVYSIFDPLFLIFMISAICIADVIFLYSLNLIRLYYFISFIATQSAFLIGFLMFRPLKIAQTAKINYSWQNDSINVLFILSSLIYISAQVFSYWKNGLPILAESRIAIYYDQGFIGSSLNKIIPATSLLAAVLAIHFLIIGNSALKFFSYIILFLWSIFSILSGAKSNFIFLIYITNTYILFASKYLHSNKTERFNSILKYLFILSIITALIIISLLYDTSNPLYYFLLRMVQSGDTYFYAYPNDIINQVSKANILVALFPGLAKLLGIINSDNMPALGIELFNIVNGVNAIDGPNPRHNVFGLAYLGPYWSVLYSFILGAILGLVRSYLYRILPATPLSSVIYVVLFFAFCSIEIDANMAFSNFVGVFIIGLLLIITSIFISKAVSNRGYSI